MNLLDFTKTGILEGKMNAKWTYVRKIKLKIHSSYHNEAFWNKIFGRLLRQIMNNNLIKATENLNRVFVETEF